MSRIFDLAGILMERYHSICSGIREGYTQGCGETHGHHKGKARSTTAFAFLLPRYLHARLSLWVARASSWRLYKHLHGFSICPVLGPWIPYSVAQHQEHDNSASGLPVYNDRHRC
jgi:hypothetical protein